MVYVLSKLFAGFFLFPGILVTVFILLALFYKKGRVITLLLATSLYLLSTPYLSNKLLLTLEDYSSSCRGNADTVVVLSGGSIAGQTLSLGNESLKRALYGFKLSSEQKLPLIYSGGGLKQTSEAQAFSQTFEAIFKPLGVDASRIILEEHSLDTYENAKFVKEILGENKRIMLVTSAYHMKRSRLLFEHFGFKVVECPTDYKIDNNTRVIWTDLLPNFTHFQNSHVAMREYFGLLSLKLQGVI